jgi:hypothetical protein
MIADCCVRHIYRICERPKTIPHAYLLTETIGKLAINLRGPHDALTFCPAVKAINNSGAPKLARGGWSSLFI